MIKEELVFCAFVELQHPLWLIGNKYKIDENVIKNKISSDNLANIEKQRVGNCCGKESKMQFFLILIFVIILFLLGTQIKSSFVPTSKSVKILTSQQISNSSRKEIEKMLKHIESSRAPERIIGAMCYSPGYTVVPRVLEYVCPIDGEKTIYAYEPNNKGHSVMLQRMVELEQERRVVEQLNSATDLVHFKLDEKRFCYTCSPNLKDDERYDLLVTRYSDGKEYVYKKPSYSDLRTLLGFFGKKLYYGTDGDQIPLKENVKLLRKMLGVI